MPAYTVDILISAAELERFYGGRVRMVQARSRCGVSLQFPAQWLLPYVRRDGVRGHFELVTDSAHRLLEMRQL